MSHRLLLGALVGATSLGLLTLATGCSRSAGGATAATQADEVDPATVEVGDDLYKLPAPAAPPGPPGPATASDPIVIPDCHLVAFKKQDVPSQQNGVLQSVLVKEGQQVKKDQLLARLDYRLPEAEYAMAEAKVAAAKADVEASKGTRDEARVRWERQERLFTTTATSKEDLDAAKLMYIRYYWEAINKDKLVASAERERDKAKTTLEMYEIRSAIRGVVKAVYRKEGEAVKGAPSFDPIFQIQDLSELRADGTVEKQYLSRITKGIRQVTLEAAKPDSPQQTLMGHLQEITGVGFSRDGKLIVSASGDPVVRVWDWQQHRFEKALLRHPGAIRVVVCTPAGAKANYCLAGAGDGKLFLWDLDDLSATTPRPLREFAEQHRGAVTCAAFSPDGAYVATGGKDMDVCLWETATGTLKYRFPPAHRAEVTSLQFLPESRLISTARDNTLRLWQVGTKGARSVKTMDRRSGDVTAFGASPDGRRVLFDQGKALRILSVPDGLTKGVIQNPTGANNFSTFAMFSPDSRLIVTAGLSEGRLQVWRAPGENTRASEVRQLVTREGAPATCASFSPDGSYLVTGTRDQKVLVWVMPTQEETDSRLEGELEYTDVAVESESRRVRVWAKFKNPEERLLPGDTVTVVIYPKE